MVRGGYGAAAHYTLQSSRSGALLEPTHPGQRRSLCGEPHLLVEAAVVQPQRLRSATFALGRAGSRARPLRRRLGLAGERRRRLGSRRRRRCRGVRRTLPVPRRRGAGPGSGLGGRHGC